MEPVWLLGLAVLNLRLLLIADRSEYRLLVRKHVEIEWPQVAVAEHRLGEDLPLEAKFTAAGYDAAIIVGAPGAPAGELVAAELLAKEEFAPLILVLLEDPPEQPPPDQPRLQRLYGRKL